MTLPAEGVYIHHSVSSVSDDINKDMRSIEASNLSDFGQFAYSWCIHPRNGEVLEGAGILRGAHTKYMNSKVFGIAWIGNYQERDIKIQQLDSTRQLIAILVNQKLLVPNYYVKGHRDLIIAGKPYATACPGNKLYAILPEIRVPWRGEVPDDPNLPNIEGPVRFQFCIDSNGICQGYYIYSEVSLELHGYGPGAPFYGRSEDITPP